ncbi:MAG: hypothetical protein ACYSWX_15810, partial [Planctomycetota bacterium]
MSILKPDPLWQQAFRSAALHAAIGGVLAWISPWTLLVSVPLVGLVAANTFSSGIAPLRERIGALPVGRRS